MCVLDLFIYNIILEAINIVCHSLLQKNVRTECICTFVFELTYILNLPICKLPFISNETCLIKV